MSDLSRRSLLAGVPAAAVTVAAPVAAAAAVAVAAGSDSIFAAIETHRAAWGRYSALDDPSDVNYARQNGIVYTDADHKAYDEANDAEEAAYEALLSHPCRTLEAARAKAAYLLSCTRSTGCMWEDWQVALLLESMAGAADG